MKRMPRRIFTEEFKKEAVRFFKQQDLTLAEVSRNLDIAPKSVNRHPKLSTNRRPIFSTFRLIERGFCGA